MEAICDKNKHPTNVVKKTILLLNTLITIAIRIGNNVNGWNNTEIVLNNANETTDLFLYKYLYSAKAIIHADVAVLIPEFTCMNGNSEKHVRIISNASLFRYFDS